MTISARVPLVAPSFRLPRWVAGFLETRIGGRRLRSPEMRMELAIALARENGRRGSGGPFGAAVFERDTGRLVAVGVNVVVASGLSLAHAEMLALSFAQRVRGQRPLLALGGRPFGPGEIVLDQEEHAEVGVHAGHARVLPAHDPAIRPRARA